ncbi:fumarylacetoacetase [Pseudomonas sp. TUM22785]|uniref:fumarylacetoacetase n=1 Tax=Pseudomonas sp. TUM22785 TaxID=3019098 RepID=UPI0023055FC4|nr:fumarylacetoacetase [Pseudomonas sp. TUM22785]WCD78201.1 fumarylacetoacetase [Pseudomonas sp. TUM22785]
MTQNDNRRSWIASANEHPDFPLQNLPLGIFSPVGGTPRGGVAIGEQVFDLKVATTTGLFEGEAADAARVAAGEDLNAFFALGANARRALRRQLQDLLAEGSPAQARLEALGAELLPAAADCQLHLPARIGDYTDFYVGIHHANNVGRLFRPDNPLLPNYKYVPIGYHGRASTVCVSGTPVHRPNGQTLPPGAEVPNFGPSKRLDYELELGIWIGQGNAMGDAIAIGEAEQHIAGYCLLNDWSARDLQAWEYQPLGPFLAKNFATSVSPWVVTAEALEPFRTAQPARPEGDPQPLPYLLDANDQARGAFDIQLEVLLQTAAMRERGQQPQRLALSNTQHMYWTVAQLVAHHAVGGCKLQPGDLFGSGTLSGPEADAFGSLLESTFGGKQPLSLASGEQRTFLESGDEVILRAWCEGEGRVRIGFGECRGRVL